MFLQHNHRSGIIFFKIMIPSTAIPENPSEKSLEPDVKASAEEALSLLGDALRRVVSRFNATSSAPRTLEKALGLNKTLCWRVLQVAFAREPLSVVANVPGDEGIEIFLQAASRAGVVKAELDAVREAMSKYRLLAKSHSGDRASFEVMLMSMATLPEETVELKAARRAGYRSTSYAWGVQTAVRILAGIITPLEGNADAVDFATLRGHVRARRVRKEGVIRLSRTIEQDTDEPGVRRARALPIEPEHVSGGVPLLVDFCTHPLPKMAAVELPHGNVEYRFADQPIGEQSAITVFTGEVRRGLVGARWRSAANTSNALMLTARDPLGLSVIDLWAPPGMFSEHRGLVVSAVGVDPLSQRPADWHVLPSQASIERLGKGVRASRLTEAPDYEDAIARCFERLAWNASQYELHRLRLDYPVVGSCLVLQTQLPERVD